METRTDEGGWTVELRQMRRMEKGEGENIMNEDGRREMQSMRYI